MNEQLPRVRFTPMQRLFIEAYLVYRNATKAAIAAGCKERSAHAVGWKWFNKTEIRAKIESRLASTLDRYAITSERIMRELALIAFANIGDFIAVQDDGSLRRRLRHGDARADGLAEISRDRRAHDRWRGAWRAQGQDQHERQKTGFDGPGKAASHAAGRSPRALRLDRACRAAGSTRSTSSAMAPEEREQLRTVLLKAVADKAL